MEIGKFRTDPTLENQGVWIDLGDGAKILVARAGNRKHAELLSKLTSDPGYKQRHKQDTVTEEEYETILVTCLAKTILLGWEGLTENGVEVPYTVERAMELLKMRDFRKLVQESSAEAANFRHAAIGETTESLKKS